MVIEGVTSRQITVHKAANITTYLNSNYLNISKDLKGQKSIKWVEQLLFEEQINITDRHKFMENAIFDLPAKKAVRSFVGLLMKAAE